MDELERLRQVVSEVRQAAKGAQTWHTILDPYEILQIVGPEESKTNNEVPRMRPSSSF